MNKDIAMLYYIVRKAADINYINSINNPDEKEREISERVSKALYAICDEMTNED